VAVSRARELRKRTARHLGRRFATEAAGQECGVEGEAGSKETLPCVRVVTARASGQVRWK